MSCSRRLLTVLVALLLASPLAAATPSGGGSGGKRPLDERARPEERATLETPEERKSFPHLGRHYEVLGPASKRYNCIAWSLGVTDRWVWPGEKVSDFDALYGDQGYKRRKGLDFRREPGVDKVVLYGKVRKDGSVQATHAARQLSDGAWSSKLGQLPLIRHRSPDDLDGDAYGHPVAVYTRPRSR
jgi:type VI secretion system secreted protein VgrG